MILLYINGTKDIDHMVISIDVEKDFDKISSMQD
jgi:hypothetical protein